tara:strand:+ start:676 stop:933 length:258 start_codon:yes stop_codon:yes gene_type:complete
MKLLSFSIVLSSLIFSFQYAWTNRLEFKNADLKTKIALKGYTVIFNKWTGNHCIFFASKGFYKDSSARKNLTLCKVDKNGRIVYP